MKIIKSIIFIFLLSISFLFYWYYNDGKLGKGDYFLYKTGFPAIKSFSDNDIYLAEIYQIKYSNNFIIAARLPIRFLYDCPSEKILYDNKFQYLIIDKHTNIIYGTYDKNKFIKKLKSLKVGLSFSAYDYKVIKDKYNKRKHLYEVNHKDIKDCKTIYNDDIIKY